eukprot:6481347-Amphidinium_carterae.1
MFCGTLGGLGTGRTYAKLCAESGEAAGDEYLLDGEATDSARRDIGGVTYAKAVLSLFEVVVGAPDRCGGGGTGMVLGT